MCCPCRRWSSLHHARRQGMPSTWSADITKIRVFDSGKTIPPHWNTFRNESDKFTENFSVHFDIDRPWNLIENLQVIVMKSMVSRVHRRYTRDYLTPGIYIYKRLLDTGYIYINIYIFWVHIGYIFCTYPIYFCWIFAVINVRLKCCKIYDYGKCNIIIIINHYW